MSQQQEGGEKKLQIHVSQDLEYVYRDIINIHVGPGDVVLEFGNQHRSMPGQGTIFNRIVLSVSNAYNLSKSLQHALKAAEQQVRKNLQAQKETGDQNTGGVH